MTVLTRDRIRGWAGAPLAVIASAVVVALAVLTTGTTGRAPALDGPVLSGAVADCHAIATDPRSVTVIGDSLTKLSLPQIEDAFRQAGRPLCFNAQSGRRSDQAVEVLEQLYDTGQLSPTVVLALGTNDTSIDSTSLDHTYDQLLSYTSAHTTTLAVGWRGTVPTDAARVQATLDRWTGSSPAVSATHWGDIVKADPHLIGPDRIHPSADGKVAYAAFLLAAARAGEATFTAATDAVDTLALTATAHARHAATTLP